MTAIQYKYYPTMPEFRHVFRPEYWPADEDYFEVFHVEDKDVWFATMYAASGGSQRSVGHPTKEAAEEEIAKYVTFHRKFWDEKVEWMSNGDKTTPDKYSKGGAPCVRIGGYHFTIAKEPSPAALRDYRQRDSLGHGGREFKIRFHDGREVVTHNLWSQGKIDPEYLPVLTDNAEFID